MTAISINVLPHVDLQHLQSAHLHLSPRFPGVHSQVPVENNKKTLRTSAVVCTPFPSNMSGEYNGISFISREKAKNEQVS